MNNDTLCYLLASESVAKLLQKDAGDALVICPWLQRRYMLCGAGRSMGQDDSTV